MSSENLHEAREDLPEEVIDKHRAITSLMEELDAVDWYDQRASVTTDAELKAILLHNRDEEMEHAAMVLEWLRRRHPVIDENLRTYLFTQGDIIDAEEAATGGAPQVAAGSAPQAVAAGPDGSLGTWLVSNVLDDRFPAQVVEAGDRAWDVALRFKRHYYPFEIELIEFSHDRYPGTEIPFNFSSEVIVHHTDSSKTRKALIYMNHPLRYEGLTFYQASFANDDRTSIFQVVRNPGWLLPYVSVLLMGLGMAVQFGIHFFRFLRKRQGAA